MYQCAVGAFCAPLCFCWDEHKAFLRNAMYNFHSTHKVFRWNTRTVIRSQMIAIYAQFRSFICHAWSTAVKMLGVSKARFHHNAK